MPTDDEWRQAMRDIREMTIIGDMASIKRRVYDLILDGPKAPEGSEADASPPRSSTDCDDAFLIVKRGLYFRPNCQGYTGIRDEAGRYSHAAAQSHAEHGECTIVLASEAPEFMPLAYNDLVIKHLTKQRDEALAALNAVAATRPEPVAWTNEAQLEYLRDKNWSEIPMAMWSKPGGAVDIPLYRDVAQRWELPKSLPLEGFAAPQPASVAQAVPDREGAAAAAEAICDYTDNNLTMMDACDMDTSKAAELHEAAKRLRDMLAPSVPSTEGK